ncbi:hypothetical protein ACRBEV_29310 [Methylobacterium phyllosphaerae]
MIVWITPQDVSDGGLRRRKWLRRCFVGNRRQRFKGTTTRLLRFDDGSKAQALVRVDRQAVGEQQLNGYAQRISDPLEDSQFGLSGFGHNGLRSYAIWRMFPELVFKLSASIFGVEP